VSSLPRLLEKWFPRPKLLVPPAVGVDISDASIKWIVLEGVAGAKRVVAYGLEVLQPGIVVSGIVKDVAALGLALRGMKEKLQGIDCAHAALPEEAGYVFSMHVPEQSTREQILSVIEFELEGRVPIPPEQAVFDFDIIQAHADGTGTEIGVVVFSRELAESYVTAFNGAGMQLLSLEVEARSVARAVSGPAGVEPITLLVDFGRTRTGFTVLKRGIPIFTSTVNVGGETIDRALAEKMSLTGLEAEKFKNEQGLLADGGAKSPGLEVVSGTASALADEVARLYHYWDTRRNEHGERMTRVEQVLLIGGSANLHGLDDYIAGRVQADTHRPDVWRNACSLDDYIPPLDSRTARQYGTAIGLALRNT
jgi:type IV pilus assembly protein PilM